MLLGIGRAGNLDVDLVVALLADGGLGEAELVDAGVEALDGPLHRVGLLGRGERMPELLGEGVEVGLDDGAHAAREVEAELDRLLLPRP